MTEQDIPFSQIEPLVTAAEQIGDRLKCTFTCPVSSKSANAMVGIVEANSDTLGTKVRSRLRSGAIQTMARSATRSLRSLFGSGVVGRLASEIANDKAKEVAATGGFSTEELQRAQVAAFKQVLSQFAWNPEHEGYVHRSEAQTVPVAQA